MLDPKWLKREVRYCLTPLGAAGDRVRQTGGRHRDETGFDFMMHMGVWTGNLSLPAVLNECVSLSYDSLVRVFPDTIGLGPASFRHLRPAGAFLVSARWDGRRVTALVIESEKRARVRLAVPWPANAVLVNGAPHAVRGGKLERSTLPGVSRSFAPA